MNPVKTNIIDQESIQERNLQFFLKNFPGVVSTGEDGDLVINTDKLKLALDPKARFEENGYELNWVGKKEAYHQAYAKQTKILKPLQDDSKLQSSDDFLADTTENILIKGDNLEALKLLKASYFEQIKMIYIDPPYNTKSENFIYRDNFTDSEDTILDELGYSADYKDYIQNIQGARTHSGWLSFMFPRLLLARDLLKDDGVIFISIDDNEQANLKLLCDEVFGEINFVENVVWEKKVSPSNDSSYFSNDHEYILIYAKSKTDKVINRLERTSEHNKFYKNTDNDPRGPWNSTAPTCNKNNNERPNLYFPINNPNTGEEVWPRKEAVWAFSKTKMNELLADNRIYWGANGNSTSPRIKNFLSEAKKVVPRSILHYKTVGHTQSATNEIKSLLPEAGFNYPKPSTLIRHLTKIALGENKDDTILDFFAGSGTTGQAVMDLNAEDGGNRQFILVQLPEAIDAKKQKDAYEFVTKTLSKPEATIFEITAERLRRAGEKIKIDHANKDGIENLDIGFKAFEITDDPMQQFYKPLHEVTATDLEQLEMALSHESSEANLNTILVNLLLAEKLPLSTPIITLQENALYQAANVLLIVNAIALESIKTHLLNRSGLVKVEYICVYSPNISSETRDQFNQELIPALKQTGLDEARLRFRG
ncbi:site-specific DNA-methyltransferase [Thiomicrorhabdus sp. Kp2]|uniref:site-specific DNA-methyltransferase n=1 Tax=Thiomicrorhabdus sp. Kp2 TaxID=1123518 RepID=UPI00041EB6A3|nr:site-specific DNA-methyltransferase [Thiomicrorhabdus sp. Kp2]